MHSPAIPNNALGGPRRTGFQERICRFPASDVWLSGEDARRVPTLWTGDATVLLPPKGHPPNEILLNDGLIDFYAPAWRNSLQCSSRPSLILVKLDADVGVGSRIQHRDASRAIDGAARHHRAAVAMQPARPPGPQQLLPETARRAGAAPKPRPRPRLRGPLESSGSLTYHPAPRASARDGSSVGRAVPF